MLDSSAKAAKTDFALLILVLALTFIGIPLVYDTSFPHGLDSGQSPFHFAQMQLIWVVAGLGGMVAMMLIPYWKLKHIAPWILGICGIALLAVFIPHIGIRENNASRWIGHGQLRIQPSEFAKAALILFVSACCCTKPVKKADWTSWTSWPVAAVIVFACVIAIEPDLGTATVALGSGFAILYAAGMPKRRLTAILGCMVLLGLTLGAIKSIIHQATHPVAMSQNTRKTGTTGFFQLDRILVWLHPDDYCKDAGYQVCLSRAALGSGGLLGAGFGDGRQKYILPEADSDFIFSTVGEELGFAGSVLFVFLYSYFVFRGVNIASSSSDPFGVLLATGISTMIGLQAFINVATVSTMIPATGLPLPFISYGGSSLCVCLTLVGILLNISRHPKGDPDAEAKRLAPVPGPVDDFHRRWRQNPDSFRDSAGVRAPRRKLAQARAASSK